MAASSMRDIKAKINATRKTAQITKAMYMVSASKLKRAERKIKGYQPYLKSIQDTIATILNSSLDLSHKMLEKREIKRTAYILITSDRGLAGGYNSNLIREFFHNVKLRHQSEEEYVIGVLGQKGYNYFRSKQIEILNRQPYHVRDDIQFVDFIELIQYIMDLYLIGKVDEVIIYYNQYVNTITQKVVAEKVLPIEKLEGNINQNLIYEFEPSAQKVLDNLIPIYIQNVIYGFILNAKTSEYAAQMTAMNNATDNAMELIDTLTLHYNRARQAAITQEITEIVSGAAALE